MKTFMIRFVNLSGKGILIGILSLFALLCIIQIVFLIGLAMGPGKDDVALFHGNKYAISKSPTSYDLYEKDKVKILSHVHRYLVGKDKSYIANHSELVIINEQTGTFTRKSLNDLTQDEREIIKKSKIIKPSL